jgi:bla regulator protein blaR1
VSRLLLEHVWQSTLFAAAAWPLAWMSRHQGARTRYWIWFAAALKFAVPFAVLTALGRLFTLQTGHPSIGVVLEHISQPLAAPAMVGSIADFFTLTAEPVLWLWAAGCAVVLIRWSASWIRAASIARTAIDYRMSAGAAGMNTCVLASALMPEPGVIGIIRPVIVLPVGIAERLSRAQLDAVIAHELCHVRRRDNLVALLYMGVQCVFWFHPLVWLIGSRLMLERELACDEAVLAAGNEPRTYAEAILSVCRLRHEACSPCIAEMAGADLTRRIEFIMRNRVADAPNGPAHFALAFIGCAAVALPAMAGVTIASTQEVRSIAARLRLDSAHVQLTPADYVGGAHLHAREGQLHMRNMSLRELISIVYGIRQARVFGGPTWLDSPRYDIDARANLRPIAAVAADPTFYRPIIDELLAAQFNLRVEESP